MSGDWALDSEEKQKVEHEEEDVQTPIGGVPSDSEKKGWSPAVGAQLLVGALAPRHRNENDIVEPRRNSDRVKPSLIADLLDASNHGRRTNLQCSALKRGQHQTKQALVDVTARDPQGILPVHKGGEASESVPGWFRVARHTGESKKL